MNVKIPEIVTPPSIYHDCSTWKTLWEKKFTLVNMNNCGRRNFRKQGVIKDGEKYITLDISLDFVSLERFKLTSSEQNNIWEDQ